MEGEGVRGKVHFAEVSFSLLRSQKCCLLVRSKYEFLFIHSFLEVIVNYQNGVFKYLESLAIKNEETWTISEPFSFSSYIKVNTCDWVKKT